ncbi:MAG: ferritin-like protein [Dehalococcoidia bacterium]
MEPPVRIENRAQLIYLLTEAAELEHGIMCCYLFSAFSMKRDSKEGLTEKQLDAVERWRGTILQIAIEEMVHMSLACNLLTSVGGAPHLRRPNLPANPKAYPPTFRLELAPFGRQSLESFVFLERPENQEPGPGLTGNQNLPLLMPGRFSDIFSSERQYQTVGHLYRGIEDGLRYLTQKYGEDGLFIGPREAQIADDYFSLPGLIPVTDLASAVAAIEGIVEQGEGARMGDEQSHHGRFLAISQEYDELLAEDPNFEPGRPVLRNPYAMFPNDIDEHREVNLIEDPSSMDMCNLFDGCYELLMQMLGRVLLHQEETEEQLILLSDLTVGMMIDVIGPLGETLTTLPAGTSYQGLNAGPSFRFSRDVAMLPHQTSAWVLLSERLRELAAFCGFIETEGEVASTVASVRRCLLQYAEKLTAT